MSAERAFLEAIREAPDDDAPRLIYADWLDDHGGPAEAVRADFIRVQCSLATLAEDDPRRPALAEREAALLTAHKLDWTDLAFADWLEHRKRDCRNPEGHNFCKLVARGVRTRCERERLPEGDARRKKLQKKLDELGERMEDETDWLPGTCEMPLFERAKFRRGFIENVLMQDFAVILFAEALADLTVVRTLEIEDDSAADGYGDKAFWRLVSILDRLQLQGIDSHAPIDALETVHLLAAAPAFRRLATLKAWFDDGVDGDEAVGVLATSPHPTGLRSLELEAVQTFTDAAFVAILESPTLVGLTHCWLRPGEGEMLISAAVFRRFEARFGPEGVQWATVRETGALGG